ncbi:unnamed protein product [Brachionus calyciflorus]|uniref:Core Histone H2A/H2B/H3 domain-containing protein n=1 Tax=Brachionus calyciflorus TaxID=104777 RepID=A0A813ML10_9BILA|nr:unnamed protein product [Brachionus calyciflorus]
MVKRKSLPKPVDKAGYAARTAQRVSDSTSEESASSSESSSSASEEENYTTRTSPRKSMSATASKLSRINTSKKGKSGIVALKQIRELQRTTNLLIPRAPFLRLIKEIIQQRSTAGFKVTEMAVEALREASENVLVSIFEDSYLIALHAKRVTLMPRDISLLLRIRNDFSLLTSL